MNWAGSEPATGHHQIPPGVALGPAASRRSRPAGNAKEVVGRKGPAGHCLRETVSFAAQRREPLIRYLKPKLQVAMLDEDAGTGLPELTRPRTPVEEALQRQITEGEGLQDGFGRKDPATLERECRVWREYTRDLLTTLFTDAGLAREFESAASPTLVLGAGAETEVRLLSEALDDGLTNLRSLQRRLELFPAPEPKLRGPKSRPSSEPRVSESRSVFLVHGHDEGIREAVARFLERLGLDVTILHEKPSEGRTIIEKLEAHADVRYAVVLLTPDDVGHPVGNEKDARPRARQNVILELGYFMGALGRAKVAALHTGEIELPSDMAGVLYVPLDAEGAWHLKLALEIKAAGVEIDLNKAL